MKKIHRLICRYILGIVILSIIILCIYLLLKSWSNEKLKVNIPEFNQLMYDFIMNNPDNTLNKKFFNNNKVYYINLERSLKRRQFMESQFDLLKIPNITRINAVDGRQINKNEGIIKTDKNHIHFTNNYNMDEPGELGCILSHMIAIKEAYYSNSEIVLILEDDVFILPLFLYSDDRLQNIIDTAPKDWTLINLLCSKDCIKLIKKSEVFIPYNMKSKCYSTSAYLINRKGMENILYGMPKNEIILDRKDKQNADRVVSDIFLYKRGRNSYTYCDYPLFFPNWTLLEYNDISTIHTNNDLCSIVIERGLNTYTFRNINNELILYDTINSNAVIPHILHQTWKNKELPDNFKRWSQECIRLHQKWKYILWTDEDNRNFISKEYPWFLNTYDSYDVNIKRVDAVRYFYLYHYGGVYMDMDFICLKSLDFILQNNMAIFGYQTSDKNSIGAIANAFMAAPPKHPLFKILVSNLQFTSKEGVIKATGPGYLTNIINKYKREDIIIHDMPIIYTHEWDKKDNKLKTCEIDVKLCRKYFPNSYTTTAWTGSWL